MKRYVVALLTVVCLSLIWPNCARVVAEAPNITIKAEVDKAFITIGERIAYTVTVRHGPDIELIPPIRFPNTRDFEVKGVVDIPPEERDDGLILEGRAFTVTTYTLGEYIIEGAKVAYVYNSETHIIQSDQLYITVQSIDETDKEKTDIRTIKGLANIPDKFAQILIVILILLIVGGASAFFMIKHLDRKKQLEREVPLLPPHEEAYQALEQLFNSDLLRNQQFKAYYFRLSEIMRRYIERQTNVHAVEMTTMEILYNLKSRRLEEKIRKKIGTLLADCDLVKFAKYIPQEQEIITDKKLSKDIIEATKPKEEAPADANPTKKEDE